MTQVERQFPTGQARAQVLDLAVTALASQKLGRFADAHAALEKLQSLVNSGPGSDQEAIGFLREVESEVHE